ncbi:MAG TPA: hypothetical protein VMJ34_08855 [Bryobacteraceae bacterium]|nr:hypothetical protein [Bryobacteraceae bacterium]
MDRRQFVGALGSSLALPGAVSSLLGGETGESKPYGSGWFGRWMDDEFGLPAFRYECDQTKDPKAVTSVPPGLLSSTDHVHQVGNDRIVGIVSNYGYVSARQDEGSPKFLNEHNPARGHYGGGIGWLTDGTATIGTYYSGGADFERIFGTGYFRKKIARSGYVVDQIVTAPFGDDPVLLSQVTVTNAGKSAAKLRWIEYWGCQLYQFSMRSWMESFANPAEARRHFADRFTHRFEKFEGGLLESKKFLGRAPEEETAWQKMVTNLKVHPNSFLTAPQDSIPEASFDDLNPPATFLASLDAPVTATATNAARFFGAGGVQAPSGLGQPLDGDLSATGPESGLLLERAFELKPGEKRTLYFLYGYLPAGFESKTLVEKYRKAAPSVWRDSSRAWKGRGMTFDTPGEPWIRREMAWDYYYLRSSLTFDSFFGEHILSQGGMYQYVMGFQGAARDPLQHMMPFLFSDPAIVKSVLRYTLKEVRPDGSIPYAIVGNGMVAPMASDNASDLPLWLLWTASEYVMAWRDKAFLDEKIQTWRSSTATVHDLLARCFKHLVDDVGVGEHGIMRMLNDDWNDALVSFWGQRALKEVVEKSESVLNSAMAAWVFDYYAQMLAYAGDAASAGTARAKAADHRKATASQWTGEWVRRCWLGPTLGWLGEKGLWLEPQPWAILGGATTPEQTRTLIRAMDEQLRKPSTIGAIQITVSPDTAAASTMSAPGTSVNGGVWPSLNQTLVWALAAAGEGRMAWDEWLKNTLARHAAVYPEIWYHNWSGSDCLNSAASKQPGETVNSGFLRYTAWPVGNLHSHAPTMYSLAKVLGLEFGERGVRWAPVAPLETFRFESPLVGLVKTAAGYEGWYAPAEAGEWEIALALPVKEAKVNGARVQVKPSPEGIVVLKGASAPGKPLRWWVRI